MRNIRTCPLLFWACGNSKENRTMQNAALRPPEAAAYLGIGLSTLWSRVRTDSEFPQPRKLGPRVTIFIRKELDAFLARCAPKAKGAE